MLASPVTRVEKTSGAMIILIMRRKMSVTMLKYEASSLAAWASFAYSWHPQPTAMPSSIATPIWVVRRLVFIPPPTGARAMILALGFMVSLRIASGWQPRPGGANGSAFACRDSANQLPGREVPHSVTI